MSNDEQNIQNERVPGSELPDEITRRSAARLAAVQVLYQLDVSGGEKNTHSALAQFSDRLLDNKINAVWEEMLDIEPDLVFLKTLVEGVCQGQEAIDALMVANLSEKWRPERLDPVLKAVLRAGIFELTAQLQTPTRVIINEYTDVTAAFADEKDTGFINGILDNIAQSVRHTDL